MKARKTGWALAVLMVVTLACSLSGQPDSGVISVEISSPANGDTVQVGQEVFVVASAIAEQGVSKVYLSVNGQIVGTEEPVGLPQAHVTNFKWVPVAEGSVVLSVVASDGAGEASEPVSLTVTITAASAVPTEEVLPSNTPEAASPTDSPTNTPQPADTNAPPTATYTPHPPTPTVTPSPTSGGSGGIGIITLVLPPGLFLLPNVETVWQQVNVPANNVGNVTATCPDGKLALAGGYAGSSDVYVYTQSRQGNGWQVYGSNQSGNSKLLNAYVVCISNVANGSVTQVYSQVTAPANNWGHATVSCPAGSTVVGGGWATNSTGSLWAYNSSKAGNGWQVYAKNTKNTGQLMNAYAICLSSTSSISSVQYSESVNISSGASEGKAVSCPAGDFAVGGGFALSDGLLNYNTSPKDSSKWEAYAKNTSGSSEPMIVYGICLSFD